MTANFRFLGLIYRNVSRLCIKKVYIRMTDPSLILKKGASSVFTVIYTYNSLFTKASLLIGDIFKCLALIGTNSFLQMMGL